MIWECADCGHQTLSVRRPLACRFCGLDVRFFVHGKRLKRAPRCRWSVRPRPGREGQESLR